MRQVFGQKGAKKVMSGSSSVNQSIIVSEGDEEGYATPPEDVITPHVLMKMDQTPSRNIGGSKKITHPQVRSQERVDT